MLASDRRAVSAEERLSLAPKRFDLATEATTVSFINPGPASPMGTFRPDIDIFKVATRRRTLQVNAFACLAQFLLKVGLQTSSAANGACLPSAAFAEAHFREIGHLAIALQP